MKVAGALGTALTLTAAYDFHTHAHVSSKELDFLHASFLFCFLREKKCLFSCTRTRGCANGGGEIRKCTFCSTFLGVLYFFGDSQVKNAASGALEENATVTKSGTN
jgi:hypothetical protein